MEQGRVFKRSAEARLNAYLRPESPMFAVLKNRPPMDSPYAKYDRMMSRFEALDSLLTFGYAQFYCDLANNVNSLHWWQNSAPYFETLTMRHMEGFINPGPAEEALHGIQYVTLPLSSGTSELTDAGCAAKIVSWSMHIGERGRLGTI
jgi:hypothetical protein